MKKRLFLLAILASASVLVYAKGDPPGKKQIDAHRIEKSLKLDGVLDEPEWLSATVADGFIQTSPDPGVRSSQKTEVRIFITMSPFCGRHLVRFRAR
ncbi:MAG: hypothetical protein IPJ40_11460 [Saprospirales bacterium]|nr:hypothetical protein [Saprospirales bacterium]